MITQDGKISLPSSQELTQGTKRKAKKQVSANPGYWELVKEQAELRTLTLEVLGYYQSLVDKQTVIDAKLGKIVDALRKFGFKTL